MKTTGEKIKERRITLNMTQKDLADQVGTTVRTISSYEAAGSKPRGLNLRKLCSVLNVSEAYLLKDEIEDETYGLDEAPYIENARATYGKKGADDISRLLLETQAMFAGGEIPEEDKDLFFQAITEAYFANKNKASERFTRKDYRKD